MNERILILSGIQLSTNPRVVKEADTLAEAGYDVEVVGSLLEPSLASRDRHLYEDRKWKYTVLANAASVSIAGRFKWQWSRARFRFWRSAGRGRFVNPRQLGYVAPELLRYALDNPADLVILHVEQALWAGVHLLERGRKVAVDVEDWYSENLVGDDRFMADALRKWERRVLPNASYVTTTSHALANALADAYGCRIPEVIYNAFRFAERDSIDGETRDRKDRGVPSIFWFSQVVGPGRGLETLFDAASMLDMPVELHIRGKVSDVYRNSLIARLPENLRSRAFFHPQVPHHQLISRTAEHDIGLASEIADCRSRLLTVTNKLPFYLLAGVPVLASDTAGQREVAEQATGAVTLFEAGDAKDLARALRGLLADRAKLGSAREAALAAAERTFSWEKSAPVLLEQVRRALDQPRKGANVAGTIA